MCGRFTQHYTWREIHDLYGLVGAPRNVEPRYNIAPTSTIDVVLPTVDGPALVPMRWGIIPSWWKNSTDTGETVLSCTIRTRMPSPGQFTTGCRSCWIARTSKHG
jgi:putative SOS response-associated peptidase YedK